LERENILESSSLSPEEIVQKQQLEELDRQFQENSGKVFSDEKLKKQIEELDKLHQAAINSLSPAPDVETQLEELDKSREGI